MAIFKLGSVVTEMKGKLGGQSLQMKGSRLFASSNPSRLKNPKQSQNIMRGYFAKLKLSWKNLSSQVKDSWNYRAKSINTGTEKNNGNTLTGRELYIKINMIRGLFNSITNTPPLEIPPITPNPITKVIFNSGGTLINIFGTRDHAANEFTFIYCSAPFPVSKKKGRDCFRLVGYYYEFASTQITLGADYFTIWAVRPKIGCAFIIKYFTFNFTTNCISAVNYFRATNQ